MQNTRHNDMAVCEKAYNSRDYKDIKMKYSFDINDIEHASRCWYAQLDLLAETEEADTQRVLDADDIKYITKTNLGLRDRMWIGNICYMVVLSSTIRIDVSSVNSTWMPSVPF